MYNYTVLSTPYSDRDLLDILLRDIEIMKNGRFVDGLGNVYYYRNGLIHRDDGPAVEYPDGSMYWYQNDQLHREDGPAVVLPSVGIMEWYLYGVFIKEDIAKKSVNDKIRELDQKFKNRKKK
jgi:hypothetical protein